MHHTNTHHRRPMAATALVLLLACLGLAACGGSSSNSSTTTTVAAAAATATAPTSTATAPTSTGSAATGAPGGGRFAAMRACLQKEGITLPQRTPGQRPKPGAGGFLGGGAGGQQLPKGVTRAQFEAALKKCSGGRPFGAGVRSRNPAFVQTLTAFATCMRQNGVNLPSPNTSGTGPVFNTKGLNTTSAQFRAAEAKCQSTLRSGFGRRRGTSGASTGGGGA